MLYLARQGSQAGPLFICNNQNFLTQPAFRSHLKMKLLQDLNLDPSCYNTHSFRIGASTSAEAAGLTKLKPWADGEAMLTAITSSHHTPSWPHYQHYWFLMSYQTAKNNLRFISSLMYIMISRLSYAIMSYCA